jgi:hypothetical protein
MFKRLMMIGIVGIGMLVVSTLETKAYTYKGYGGCYGCNSYLGQWELAGGQNPQTTSTFLVGVFTLNTGALVCGNPGTDKRDVRSGVGGTTPIVAINSEDDLRIGKNGRFILNQGILSTVAEFEKFCTSETCPDSAQTAFEDTYGVSNLDCRNPNWTPIEFLWGNHTAEGTVFRDCDPNSPPSIDTCASVDDEVTYLCTTNVSFKNYDKGNVLFSCKCTKNCDQGIQQ